MTNTTKKTLMIGILALVLASCNEPGGETPNSSNTGADTGTSEATGDPFDPNKPVEVTFWHTMGKQNQDIVKAMITEFNHAYPNITIKETSAAGGYDDLQSLILNNVATGNLPTMAFCYPDHVAEYLDRNCVLDMSSYVDDSTYGFKEEDGKSTDEFGAVRVGVNDFVSSFWQEGKEYVKEGIYSVPFAKSTEAMFYNKTQFDAHGWTVPTTWDEMWELAREIRQAYPEKDEKGEYITYPLGYDSDSNFFITMCQQRGLDYTTNDLVNHDSHFIFNNKGVKDLLAELKGYYDEGLFKTKGTSANSTYTSTKFTAQEIMMSIGSTGGTTYNQTQNFEVGVAVPPSEDLNAPAVVSQGPSICFFNRATPSQRTAAWLFYKFISNATNSVIYGISTGYQPVRYSSYETEYYADFIEGDADNLLAKVADLSSTMFDSYFTSPVFVGSALARDQVGKMLPSVLQGTKTVDKAIDDAMSNCINGTRN